MDKSLPLPLVMAGLNRVDQLRVLSSSMPNRIDQGQALAQRLKQVYEHQDIPVSLALIQQAAQDVVGGAPAISFSNAPAWKKLSPQTAAALLSEEDIYGWGYGVGFQDSFPVSFLAGRREEDFIVEYKRLLNVFGAKEESSHTEQQRGLHTNCPKRLIHWVPYNTVLDKAGYVVIDAQSGHVRSYLAALLLWKLFKQGWSSPQEITDTCFYESTGNPDRIDWEAEAFALELLLPPDLLAKWREVPRPLWLKPHLRSVDQIASATRTPDPMVAFRAQQLGWKS